LFLLNEPLSHAQPIRVSNAAALVTWTFCAAKHPDTTKYAKKFRRTVLGSTRYVTPRHRITYLFALLFLSLAILLLVRLHTDWSVDPTAPLGSCFRSSGILAAPSAAHPGVDQAYVAVTAAVLLSSLLLAVFGGPERCYLVLDAAAAQFPVHLYAVTALRSGNQALLEADSGESENRWDFGQTAAVLLLLVTLNEFVSKARETVRFEKQVRREEKNKKKGGARSAAGTGEQPAGRDDGDEEQEIAVSVREMHAVSKQATTPAHS
jgi:hypothetical protein